MPADLGEDLHRAAPRPARDVPFALIEQRLRARVRRRIGAKVGAAALAIAAAAGGVASLSGGGNPTVRAERLAGSPPATESAASVTLQAPPGWVRSPTDLHSFAGTGQSKAAVGTTALESLPQDCFWPADIDDDVFVLAGEFPPDVVARGGELANAQPRPPDLGVAVLAAGDNCWGATPYPPPVELPPRSQRYVVMFTEGGRVFWVQVSMGSATSDAHRAETIHAVNSLRVEPRTPTTEVSPNTVPDTVPATTTPPATTPATAEDEAAIRETFRIWLDTQPRDDPSIGEHVEDYESIREAITEAAANAPLPLDGYHGRVDTVGLIDGAHAVVRFAILNDQSVVYDAAGRAVRVDGVWKVTRQTVCDAIAVGSTRCAA